MKLKITGITFLFVLFSFFVFGQNEVTGDWHGVLDVQGMMKLRVVFHLQKEGEALTATLDSPDQSSFGLPVGKTTYTHPELVLEMPALKATFKGTVANDFTEITGTFEQGGLNMPLVLTRQANEKPTLNRPQEPKPPFPYYEEEVTFENPSAGISLAGTLTLPSKEGKYLVVVLVSGSGPQDRNEELLGHKPFLVLADHLTRQGIGVLRFDDRGVGKSKGSFSGSTSEDFASDALAAVACLKTRPEAKKDKIGIVGHSEGGLIAPMCAARSKDVSFIVLLAGPGVDGEAILLKQLELINRANGYTEEKNMREKKWNALAFRLIKTEQDTALLRKKLAELLEKQFLEMPEEDKQKIDDKERLIKGEVETLTSDWFRFFVKYDPKTSLGKVKCPVLALNGEKDLQVEPKENLAGIKAALEKGKNKNFVVKELPGLNHLFQTCETGAPSEYSAIEETFSPTALKEISDWIQKTVK